MPPIKVVWYVMRVKNMHFESSLYPLPPMVHSWAQSQSSWNLIVLVTKVLRYDSLTEYSLIRKSPYNWVELHCGPREAAEEGTYPATILATEMSGEVVP